MPSSPLHIEIAVSSDLEQLIHRAAALRGQPLEQFVADAVAETSRRVLEGENTTILSDRDRDRFLELLDHPSEPNAALREAAQRCWPKHD